MGEGLPYLNAKVIGVQAIRRIVPGHRPFHLPSAIRRDWKPDTHDRAEYGGPAVPQRGPVTRDDKLEQV